MDADIGLTVPRRRITGNLCPQSPPRPLASKLLESFELA